MGYNGRIGFHLIRQIRFSEKRSGKGDECNICLIQDGFHHIQAPETADYDDRTADPFGNLCCDRNKVSFIHMGLDAAHSGSVSADLDGVDAGLIEKLADSQTFWLFYSTVGKIAAVDLDGNMKLWSRLADAVHNIQKDMGAVFR